jgi:hypothetical protein
LGTEEFRQELLASTREPGTAHYGEERREAHEVKAIRILREEMERLGWDKCALRHTAKGDEQKMNLAAWLRKNTTMSLKWIAQHLEMGSWTHVSNLLGAKRKGDRV